MTISAPVRTRKPRTLNRVIASEMVVPIAPVQFWDEPAEPVPAPAPQAQVQPAQAGISAASPVVVLVAAFLAVVGAVAACYFVARIVWAIGCKVVAKVAGFAGNQIGHKPAPSYADYAAIFD